MTQTHPCFITKIDDNKVTCYFFNLKQHRVFELYPFFSDMKIYVGKNVLFKIQLKDRYIKYDSLEMPYKKITHLFNYYLKKKFDV